MTHYLIPTSELREIVNPLDGTMWKCAPIDESEVLAAVKAGADELRVWENVIREIPHAEHRDFHINRIATMLRQNVSIDRVILVLENHTAEVRAYLNDGNHRLAAAYIRGDRAVRALIAAADPAGIPNVLPGATAVD